MPFDRTRLAAEMQKHLDERRQKRREQEVVTPKLYPYYRSNIEQERDPNLATRTAKRLDQWGQWGGQLFRGEQEMRPQFLRMGLRDDPSQVPSTTRKVGQKVLEYFGGQRDVPVDSRGRTALYGVHRGQAVYGPVNWDEFYSRWSQIGTDFNEYGVAGFDKKSLSPKQLDFLRNKGITLVSLLGEGGFGEVWKISRRVRETDPVSGVEEEVEQELAMKVMQLRFQSEPTRKGLKEAVRRISRESDIHIKMVHKNILRIDSILNIMDSQSGFPHPVCVLYCMELMDDTLLNLINKSSPPMLSEDETREWFAQICQGIRYLQLRNVAHRDIKPDNILVKTLPSGVRVFKLSDFGLAVALKLTDQSAGTPGYAPFEAYSGRRYDTFRADIYSLGVVLMESLGGKVNQERSGLSPGTKCQFPNIPLGSGVRNLINAMLSDITSWRPTIDQICDNPWVKGQQDVQGQSCAIS